jgi:CCR4-NOT transcription complex subunit 10
MDSRDSLSSDAVRDASSLSDDAAVLSVTSTLAKTALSYFQSGKFEECIDVLIQLDQMKHNDPKVQFFFFFLFFGFNSFDFAFLQVFV